MIKENILDWGKIFRVTDESITKVYDWYLQDKLKINRIYQRKLVWSLEEKQALIVSILKDYPVPLFHKDNLLPKLRRSIRSKRNNSNADNYTFSSLRGISHIQFLILPQPRMQERYPCAR